MKKFFRVNLSEMSVEDALYFFGLILLPPGLLFAYFVVDWVIPHIPTAECIFWKFSATNMTHRWMLKKTCLLQVGKRFMTVDLMFLRHEENRTVVDFGRF